MNKFFCRIIVFFVLAMMFVFCTRTSAVSWPKPIQDFIDRWNNDDVKIDRLSCKWCKEITDGFNKYIKNKNVTQNQINKNRNKYKDQILKYSWDKIKKISDKEELDKKLIEINSNHHHNAGKGNDGDKLCDKVAEALSEAIPKLKSGKYNDKTSYKEFNKTDKEMNEETRKKRNKKLYI